jgi:hypothetical protein
VTLTLAAACKRRRAAARRARRRGPRRALAGGASCCGARARPRDMRLAVQLVLVRLLALRRVGLGLGQHTLQEAGLRRPERA